MAQLVRQPGHLGAIGGRFLRDNDVHCRGLAENAGKTPLHTIRPAQHLAAQLGVSLVEPSGQPNAARHRVQFRQAQTMFGQQQVGPDDPRHFVLERERALQFDEVGGLAQIQPARDPFGLFSLGALAIQQIDRPIKLQQHPPE